MGSSEDERVTNCHAMLFSISYKVSGQGINGQRLEVSRVSLIK